MILGICIIIVFFSLGVLVGALIASRPRSIKNEVSNVKYNFKK